MKVKYLILFSVAVASILVCCKNDPAKSKQTDYDILYNKYLGLAYLEEDKLNEAEDVFKELIKLAPKEVLGYANLGLVHLRKGNYPEAEKQLKIALRKDPKDPDTRLIFSKYYEQINETEKSIEELNRILKLDSNHVKALYNLSEVYRHSDTGNSAKLRENYLNKILQLLPLNIVARLQLIELSLQNGNSDRAMEELEKMTQLYPEFPNEAEEFYKQAMDFLYANQVNSALNPVMIFHNFLKVTPAYQTDLADLKGPGGALIGSPVITFSEIFASQVEKGTSILDKLRFTDVTKEVGLNNTKQMEGSAGELKLGVSQVTTADYDNDGDLDLYFSGYLESSSEYAHFLFNNNWAGRGGLFNDVTKQVGISALDEKSFPIFFDYNNDGNLDLFVLKESQNLLYHNAGDGNFIDQTAEANFSDQSVSYGALSADLDLEGDLDLFILKSTENLFYRNNSDGSFKEQAKEMGLSGKNEVSLDAGFGDFDEDGDLDLFVINKEGSNTLYDNLRQGRFEEVTQERGLINKGNSGALAVGDYNNDGFLDLFVTGLNSDSYHLYQNSGDGKFEEMNLTAVGLHPLKGLIGLDAAWLDFDNDGFLDLFVTGKPTTGNQNTAYLFHNEGDASFSDVSDLLPDDLAEGGKIAVADYDKDGDMDLFISMLQGGVRLLQNDGGNLNHYLSIQLVGLRTGSSKNNHFGIGSKIEVRAGDLYQTKVITEPSVNFGLGHRLKADVVRILWPNGVPQNIFFPGSDQDLIESQILKGSCFFLYTWNGEEYAFEKDMLWRSALGMPMGIMGGRTEYAFADASKEYLKIPGESLQAKDGFYYIQITEELWETAYFDQLELLVVDHPESSEIYVDEGFAAPPYPPLEVLSVQSKIHPLNATDGKGTDLIPFILEKDDKYLSNFEREKYQGITENHDLILDFGPLEAQDSLYLFLNGWIFPTDASINVAIAQSEVTKVLPPSIEVMNKEGMWETVLPNIGFPMGKNKTIVVNMSGKFLSDDRKIRISTNMEIYWDQIFMAYSKVNNSQIVNRLKPYSADLHYRGFSALYRKGGRYGPHWFDYNQVTKGQKWRDLIGDYTRYGDVLPLLLESDNKYIIANSGDEITIAFEERNLPEVRKGWKRDFLIYSVGWIKDGDLNTAHGKTVGPLPFHELSSYPYSKGDSYPTDPELNKYRKEYNTRKVDTKTFRETIINSGNK